MSRKESIFKAIANAAIFIILEVAALAMLSNNGKLQKIWLSKASHAVIANVWGTGQRIGDYFRLASTNDKLAEENFNLRLQLKQYEVYRNIMDNSTDDIIGNFHYTSAEIIKFSNNSQHNYIILDKGKEDGIIPNSGIITRNGVIGIIESVSEHYSYAISFTNSAISISSRIGKSGVVGPLVWDGIHSSGAILKEIPLHITIQPGDTVYTSGHSSFFPADIPLGTATSSEIINGSTQNIKIQLFQDFKSLRYVTIVNNIYENELEELTNIEQQ